MLATVRTALTEKSGQARQVSKQFYGFSERRLWTFREMTILNDPIQDPPRTQSDHGLVRARFDWTLAKRAAREDDSG